MITTVTSLGGPRTPSRLCKFFVPQLWPDESRAWFSIFANFYRSLVWIPNLSWYLIALQQAMQKMSKSDCLGASMVILLSSKRREITFVYLWFPLFVFLFKSPDIFLISLKGKCVLNNTNIATVHFYPIEYLAF